MGSVWGYRAPPPPVPGGHWYSFTPPDPEVRLQNWSWDLLGPIPFDYEVYTGLGEDDYPDNFTMFGFMSRLIFCTIRDAPGEIIFTYDGVTEQPARRFDLSFQRLEAAVGFKIRTADPGIPCRYQVVPMQ